MSFLLERERELVRHALGCWDGFGRRPIEGYRNHFVASTGSADDRVWQSIATRGLAVAGRFVLDQTGGSTIYYVTRDGARLAGLSEAAIVRWGTTEGLAQLCHEGPRRETRLNPSIPSGDLLRINRTAVIARLACDSSKWSKKLGVE